MASDVSASGNGWFIDDVSVLAGTHPWIPIAITTPGASSYSWGVPENTSDDYCLSILGMAPGSRQSPQVNTGPFTVAAVDGDGDGYVDVMDNCAQVPNPDQRDTDSDGYGNLCDGDLNNDGSTNTLDLNLYKRAHRTRLGDPNYNPDADLNGDESINTLDLNVYRSLHRKPPGPSCCGLF
jgi:hypothetical protein